MGFDRLALAFAWWLRAAAMLAGLMLAGPAMAQSCTFAVSTMNFGTVDTLSGAATTTTATFSYSCTKTGSGGTVLICPHFGSGDGGDDGAGGRYMTSGANQMAYQLYQDPAYSTVWGSGVWPYPQRPPKITLTLGLSGLLTYSGSGTMTVYGRVPGSQSTVATGTYGSLLSGGHIKIEYRMDYSGSTCNATVPSSTTARPNFQINASVAANCMVNATDVDFGSKGNLTAVTDSTGNVAVKCTPGTSYSVGLNGGLTGGTPTNRKMTKGGSEQITYGLYRDSARSTAWGTATGTTAGGTGNGATQNITVYGRVPAQTTPSPGNYSDTVVTTVTY